MRILGSLLITATLLLAEFRVYLEKNPISSGEPARLHITGSGDEIELPKPTRIGPYPVAGVSTSESVVGSGGNYVVKKEKIITFYPDENVTIPPLQAKIDGQSVQSEPIELIVDKSKKNDDVDFRLKVNKKEAYVGEPIVAELELKIKRSLNIVDYDFIPPKFENFWVKELKSSNKYLEEHGNFLIKRIKFLLFPQKSGLLRITPAIFKFAVPDRTTDMFGFSITAPRWKSVASNSVEIVVKPLPKPVDLVGDFSLSVQVDKRKVKANEPVNLKVVIEGEGNVENLDKIDLDIGDATIYEDKPKIEERFENGKLRAKWSQSFSIIAQKSFTIPPISFEYFSLKDKKIKTLRSEPIRIEVEGAPGVATPTTQPQSGEPKNVAAPAQASKTRIALIYLAGVLSGVVITLALIWFVRRKKRLHWKFGDKKELLSRLLPHISKDPKIAAMAEALYKEIYEGKRSNIKKKDIEEVLKDLV